ncbi:hypothetical protein [Streptomyces sp. NPDC002763]|uniref:hypothetical protein n=1 Tax=Streptomyces sp. NPDC002763 TaxID=3154427 RepID=UPI0033276C59
MHAELGLRAAELYASYAERKGRTALLTLNRPRALTRATADQKEGMSAFVGRRPVEFRHR